MNNKKLIIGIIITIVVLLFILFLVYKQGKKNASPPKVIYPKGGSDIPQSWSPLPLVEKLHREMEGVPNPLTRDAVWLEVAKLPTNEMVIAVYDVFNQQYFKEGSGTLTQWVSDESVLGFPSLAKNAILNRLTSLNLN